MTQVPVSAPEHWGSVLVQVLALALVGAQLP